VTTKVYKWPRLLSLPPETLETASSDASYEVLIPRTELFAVGGARRGSLSQYIRRRIAKVIDQRRPSSAFKASRLGGSGCASSGETMIVVLAAPIQRIQTSHRDCAVIADPIVRSERSWSLRQRGQPT
jgi:hypothetical protein